MMETNVLNDELTALKQLADNMGINYHHNIGLDKLKEKVEQAREKVERVKEQNAQNGSNLLTTKRAMYDEDRKLVRIRVTCLNPYKKAWPGEIITVANRLGTHRKFVQYDTPWHVPNIIYQNMLEDKFRQVQEVPDGKGGKRTVNRFVNQYAIELLPNLTKKELEELAADQRKRGAVDED